MIIWVDADAAPRAIKEVLFKAAQRRKVQVTLVANMWLQTPRSTFIALVQVGAGADVADDYIAERCGPDDLVITADIPLASRAVKQGSLVLQPRGGLLDAENVAERLAMRDLKEELRESGLVTDGPPPFRPQDRQAFANGLDRWITAHA